MLKISIITPSYNHAEFLARTIASVQSQQGEFELEHIVIDGGSTDGTLDILREAGDAIRWTSEPDNGQTDALNKGIAQATGDIVGWLNSDDVYEPGCLAAVAKVFAAESGTQWLYGKVRVIDRDDREIRKWITAYKNFRMRRWSFGKLLTENWISQMGVFWRRSAGQEVGPLNTDLHYCMDYEYWLRLGRRWPGRFVNEYLAAFRWYATSKSGAGFGEQFSEGYDVARKLAGKGHGLALLRHRINTWKIATTYTLMKWLRR